MGYHESLAYASGYHGLCRMSTYRNDLPMLSDNEAALSNDFAERNSQGSRKKSAAQKKAANRTICGGRPKTVPAITRREKYLPGQS